MNDDTSVNERLRALGERCIANEDEITRLRQKLTCCRCAESLEDGVAFCPKCAVEPTEPLRERVTALVDLVRVLEWHGQVWAGGGDGHVVAGCPVCAATKASGRHEPGCILDATLTPGGSR